MPPRDSHLCTNARPGMTIFGSKACDPTQMYAMYTVRDMIDDIHFGNDSAGDGKGQYIDPSPAAEGRYQPRAQGMAPRQKANPKPRGKPKKAKIQFGGMATTEDNKAAAVDQEGEQEEQQQETQQIYVPGMGYMNADRVPPQVLQKLQQQRQQQTRQQQYVPAVPSFPAYSKPAPLDHGSTSTTPPSEWWRAYAWPAAVFGTIILVLYLMYKKQAHRR